MKRPNPAFFVLAAGFVLLLFNGGSRFIMGLTLGPMTDDLGWSRSTLSLTVTVFLVVSSLALPIAGRLIDRYDARFVLVSSVLLACVSIALMGAVETPLQAVILYGILFALASASTSVPAIGAMISQWFPDRIGAANGIAISGSGIGQLVIIMVLTTQLEELGWRGSFLVLGAAGLVLILPMAFFAVSPSSARGVAGGRRAGRDQIVPAVLSARAILRSRQLWLLLAVYAICGFQDHFVATHVVAFARDQGIGVLLAGNLFAFMGLFGLVGVIGSGYLSDRVGPVVPASICFALRIAIFTLVIASREPFAIAGFALLYGLTFWITAPLSVVFTRQHFGASHLGTIAGFITMVHNAAGGLGAYVGGAVFDTYGNYDAVFQLALGLSIAALLLTTMIRPQS